MLRLHNTGRKVKNCQFVIVFFKNIPQIGNKRQQISINAASLAQKRLPNGQPLYKLRFKIN
jgi:hypothetical protein